MPGILSTNNPVVKVSGLRPSTLTTGLLVLLFDKGNNSRVYTFYTVTDLDGVFVLFSTM